MTKLKFIAGIVVGTIIVTTIILLPNGNIEFCDNDSCIEYSPKEYETTRDDLMIKVDNDDLLDWNEFQLYIKIMDFEIKKKGEIVLQNMTNENVLKKINEAIRKK